MHPLNIIVAWVRELVQIGLLAVPVYYLLKFLRRTRGYSVLAGIFGIIAVAYTGTTLLKLDELGWMLDRAAVFIPIALLVVFQPELRRIFADIGGGSSGQKERESRRNAAEELHKAVMALASRRCGALIAIEREERIDPFVQGACHLDSPIVSELVSMIFYPGTALHDGGVVVRNGHIAMAGCIFPLGALGDSRHLSFGTRHRAAIGLTEKTDAAVFAVSEETGMISMAFGGRLVRGMGAESLRRALEACLPGAAEDDGGKSDAPRADDFPRVFEELAKNEA
ncbi:MAG: diadenylate cyclase CdaA [Kiritimatiellae bacterium]|nr:diadenylate cyclase CdaA [Kiritimatiellia bacterium]